MRARQLQPASPHTHGLMPCHQAPKLPHRERAEWQQGLLGHLHHHLQQVLKTLELLSLPLLRVGSKERWLEVWCVSRRMWQSGAFVGNSINQSPKNAVLRSLSDDSALCSAMQLNTPACAHKKHCEVHVHVMHLSQCMPLSGQFHCAGN